MAELYLTDEADRNLVSATASLFAAAPDLLDALRPAPEPCSNDAIAWLHSYSRWWHGERQRAIAKATCKE